MKPFPNYTLVRKDRGRDNKGGGVAFLVYNKVLFQEVTAPDSLKDDPHLDEVTISINNDKNKPLFIRNVYIPPASSCNQGYIPPVEKLTDGLGDSTLILGDINAHHSMWYTEDEEDGRGRQVAAWISDSDLGILNEDLPTRVTATTSTAPDLSISSADCLPTCTWTVDTALGSDHSPILIKMSTEISKVPAQNKTFINFNKADWTKFTAETEEHFSKASLNNGVHKSEKFFRKTLNNAAKHCIPSGRIPTISNAMPTETAKLMEDRDQIRRDDPADPRIPEINAEINNQTKVYRQNKWLRHLENCGPGTKKLWDTIKSIDKPPRQPDNQSIKFNGKHYNDPKKLASKFNSQYTPGATTKPTKEFRKLLRKIKKNPIARTLSLQWNKQ